MIENVFTYLIFVSYFKQYIDISIIFKKLVKKLKVIVSENKRIYIYPKVLIVLLNYCIHVFILLDSEKFN